MCDDDAGAGGRTTTRCGTRRPGTAGRAACGSSARAHSGPAACRGSATSRSPGGRCTTCRSWRPWRRPTAAGSAAAGHDADASHAGYFGGCADA